jgi:hypothetical protein
MAPHTVDRAKISRRAMFSCMLSEYAAQIVDGKSKQRHPNQNYYASGNPILGFPVFIQLFGFSRCLPIPISDPHRFAASSV